MRSLADIAADLVYLLADDMDEDEFARVSAMPEAEKARYCYISGDCDVFAAALHRITGWQVIGVVSPSHGCLHRLVVAPDGRLLDAAGWIDVAGLRKRYGLRRLTISNQGEASVLGVLFGPNAYGIDEQLANAVAAIRQFPWAPFCEDEFRALSGRHVDGADPRPDAPSI